MTEQALVLFDQRPTNTADRLVRYGRVQAVERAASRELDRLKDEFAQEADAIEEATGGAYNVKTDSGAQALRTQPKAKPYVRDEDALLEWLQSEGHDDLWVWERTIVMDGGGDAAVIDALDELEMGVAAGNVPVSAARAVLDCFDVREKDTPVSAVIEGLEAKGCVVGPAGLVTPDGEPVPGIDVQAGRRSLRVTIPSDLKDFHDSELRSMFQLTAGDDNE